MADIILLDVPNQMHIPYRFGVNLVKIMLKEGKVVVGSGYVKARFSIPSRMITMCNRIFSGFH